MLQNFGTALSREQMKSVFGGQAGAMEIVGNDSGGSCALVGISASCTCPANECKCQSGSGMSEGSKPGCISYWSDGSCSVVPSTECHGS